MSKEVVYKVIDPTEERKVDFTTVLGGKVYSENGEEFNPNTTNWGDDLESRWLFNRFVVTDAEGLRTYFVPGDLAPSRRDHQLESGFALPIEESLSEGRLTYWRINPHASLEPIVIGQSWGEGAVHIDNVLMVAATSPRDLSIIHTIDINRGTATVPDVDDFTFETIESELVQAGFGPSLPAIGRTVLNTYDEM